MSTCFTTDRPVETCPSYFSSKELTADGALDISAEKKTSLIYQMVRPRQASATIPLFTAAATSAQDVDGDTSYILREGCNFAAQILSLPSIQINIPSTMNIGASGPSSALFSAVGISTSFNVVMGGIGAKNAYDRFQEAIEQGSDIHKVSSGIDVARAGAQSVAGLLYIPYRFCSMATSILALDGTGFATTSPLGSTTYSLGYLGNFFFGIFYACMSAISLSNVLRVCNFSAKIWKEGDLSNVIHPGTVTKIVSFLKDRLVVTAKSTLEALQKTYANQPQKMKAELKELALRSICHSIESTLKEAIKQKVPGVILLSKEEIRKRAEEELSRLERFSQAEGSTLIADLSAMMGLEGNSFLSITELMGLDCKTFLMSTKQESELTDLIGAQGIFLLKQALDTSLLERLASKGVTLERALAEAEELIQEVRSHVKRTTYMNTGLFLAGVFGTVATVFSLIPAALITVTETIVSSALWLLCTFFLISIDVGSLFGAQNAEGPIGKYDKHLLCMSSAIGLTSLIISSVVASIFSMGVVPMVIGIVIGVLWFMNNIYSYYRIDAKQKKYEAEHPTLASFSTYLEREIHKGSGCQDRASILKRGKNLPSEEKKALKVEMARLAGITKPLERQSLVGRHGLILPPISQTAQPEQNEALQKELEDRLLLAPATTVEILEEMEPLAGLKELSFSLKKGINDSYDRDAIINLFRGLAPAVKNLVDKRISLVYGFGQMYFDQHIDDPAVLRAVEKAYRRNKGSMRLRALYDQLSIMAQKPVEQEGVLQAKEFFNNLTIEERSLAQRNIYHKIAKKRSSRHFVTAKWEDMQVALNTIKKQRAAREDEQRRDFLATRFKLLSLPMAAS